MSNMSCGGAILHQLKAYGIDCVFGIPGVHTLEFYRQMETAGVAHIGVRHEQGAGFMADGYARVSGRPGTCLLITGPGVTNAATPIGEAFADSVPVLVVSAVNARADIGMGRGDLHEITDQEAVTRPLTAFSATVHDPSQANPLLARAFGHFASRRPRPVHIQVPLDVMELPAVLGEPQKLPQRPAPAAGEVAEAAALIRGARKPVILAGGGAMDAGSELVQLAERIGAPVVTTIAAKGLIDSRHPLSLGSTLQRADTRVLLAGSDLVLVLGSELSGPDLHLWQPEAERLQGLIGPLFKAPTNLAYGGKLLRVDIDPAAVSRDYAADLPISADCGRTLEALLEVLDGHEGYLGADRAAAEAAVAAVRGGLRDDILPLEKKHIAVLDALRRALPDDGFVASDMTQIAYTANTFFEGRVARSWLHPVGYGTLGYALPAAIGAKLAAPERAGVVLIGDGGLLFTVQELATAAELRQPLAILLWNNDALGEIEDSMVRRGVPKVSVRPENPDFLKLAEAFNCRAHRATSLDDLEAALTAAFQADRPTLIEVRQDADFLS